MVYEDRYNTSIITLCKVEMEELKGTDKLYVMLTVYSFVVLAASMKQQLFSLKFGQKFIDFRAVHSLFLKSPSLPLVTSVACVEKTKDKEV